MQRKNTDVRSTRGTRCRLSAGEIQRIRDLRSAGESVSDIARALGVNASTVHYQCNERKREQQRAAARARATREGNRTYALRRNHGISISQHEQMLAIQGGGCAICGGVNRDGRALFVDHDHDCCSARPGCGKCIRGLLCIHCNMRLTHGLPLGETFLSRRECNYVRLWRKRIARERPNPWDEIRERAA